MSRSCVVTLIGLLLCGTAQAQTAQVVPATPLEGYWQDHARRILYSRLAPPSYVYGTWTMLDQGQTYPAAKHVRRDRAALEVVDLNFDDADYIVRTIAASEQRVEF